MTCKFMPCRHCIVFNHAGTFTRKHLFSAPKEKRFVPTSFYKQPESAQAQDLHDLLLSEPSRNR